MDAGTVPELSSTRNRFRRLPLSGRIADGECCEHRSGLRILAKSSERGRCVARCKFIERRSSTLDLSHQSNVVGCFALVCAFGESVLASSLEKPIHRRWNALSSTRCQNERGFAAE